VNISRLLDGGLRAPLFVPATRHLVGAGGETLSTDHSSPLTTVQTPDVPGPRDPGQV
jgi:hypothetical protein